jgi:hypothetical protein
MKEGIISFDFLAAQTRLSSFQAMIPTEGFEKQIEFYRHKTDQERFQIGLELYELARAVVQSGVRHVHPDWNQSQVDKEVNRRFQIAAGIR